MPDRELALRTKCEHGHSFGPHHGARSKTEEEFNAIVGVEDCPGGSETVLDPVVLAQIIHDLQQEHGLETRHDIGLALIDALGEDS